VIPIYKNQVSLLFLDITIYAILKKENEKVLIDHLNQ